MKAVIILNDSPYGTERSYNGLRLANALANRRVEVTLFLFADAVACAKRGQNTAPGYFNVERILRRFAVDGHKVLLCQTCMEARGMSEAELVEGARTGTIDELADETLIADKVLAF